jgi:hypothetical protein
MATTLVTSPNLWAGEYVQGINKAMVFGGDSFQAGLWRHIDSIEDKAIIKLFNYGSRLAVGNLCGVTPGTTSTMSDKVIQVTPFSINERFCKFDIDPTSYAQGNVGNAIYRQIPQEVMEAFLGSMAEAEMDNMERLRWSGDTASADALLQKQNGVIKKIKAYGVVPGTGYVRVTPASATASQDAATVMAELNKVVLAASALPTRLKPNFKIIVSPEVATAYEAALASNATTGGLTLATLGMGMINRNDVVTFLGYYSNTRIPMYVATGLRSVNKEVILAGCFSDDINGNMILATNAKKDFQGIVVEDRQAVFASEPFVDIVWSVFQGVDVVRPTEIVLYHS